MKTALFSFLPALVLPLVLLTSPAHAEVQQDAAQLAAIAPVTMGAAPERPTLAVLQPAAAPMERQRADALAEEEGPPHGWRERLALLSAAFLALWFILRRQFTHRLGDSRGQGHAARQRSDTPRRDEPTLDRSMQPGFMLSAFDNLPPSEAAMHLPLSPAADEGGLGGGLVCNTEPPLEADAKGMDRAPLPQRPRHVLHRKPPAVRRKARWPARLRPPSA